MEIYASYSFDRHCFVWREMLFFQNSSYFFKVYLLYYQSFFYHIPIQCLVVLVRTFYMKYGYTQANLVMVHTSQSFFFNLIKYQ